MTNPLGSTEMDLNVQKNVVQLTDNQWQTLRQRQPRRDDPQADRHGDPAEQPAPVDARPAGRSRRFLLDDQYRLSKLTYQQGGQTWKVDYQGYSNEVQPTLPNRLELQQGDQRIKLKMDNWTLQMIRQWPSPRNSTCFCTSPAVVKTAITCCRRCSSFWTTATP
ncbi:lipoprotein insertase outer membrane protein LolB [Serratia ureilytica]